MITLEQIPMREDNYSYAIINNCDVIIVDPSESQESLSYFTRNPHLQLRGIINTHSHQDHIAGNDVLKEEWDCPIYGPHDERERIPGLTHAVKDNDHFSIAGISFVAHDVRAHTIGHTAYLIDTVIDEFIKRGHRRAPYVSKHLAKNKAMLVGDSLFAAGCGRLFEGTPQNLVDALTFYAKQPAHLVMACAHEYTKNNLRFAQSIFPDHEPIERRLVEIDELIANEGASIPCFFAEEHETNPFLLALSEPYKSIIARTFDQDSTDLAAVIAALRRAKDNF